ncbi:MAG: class I SAM-dependent methyltransferase [Desulfocapsa sp.]|nr:class I SAM-dependent methyltransferase [Desulfocapsa sp.]
MKPASIKEKILYNVDIPESVGVEIGALANPMVKKDDGDVRYIDRDSTEKIKEWYRKSDVVDQDKIVDVDYVWGDQTLTEATGVMEGFDYCFASHVLEHVPDLIGWLREVSSILKEKGVASFSIPDRRYTFDYLRAESTVGELLEAYFQKSRKPTVRQIYDHFSLFTELNIVEAWQPSFDGKNLVPTYDPGKAYSFCLDSVNNNKYIDTHCWVFTSTCFLNVLERLSELGLLDFKMRNFFDVEPNTFEFVVQLEKIPSALSSEEKHGLFLESLRKVHPHSLRVSFQASAGGLAQLYYDTGKGFNEEDSVIKQYSVKGDRVDLEFFFPHVPVKGLRFDPLMGPVNIKILSMDLLLAGDEENAIRLNSFQAGGNIRRSGIKDGCFFAESRRKTIDPSIIINLPRHYETE